MDTNMADMGTRIWYNLTSELKQRRRCQILATLVGLTCVLLVPQVSQAQHLFSSSHLNSNSNNNNNKFTSQQYNHHNSNQLQLEAGEVSSNQALLAALAAGQQQQQQANQISSQTTGVAPSQSGSEGVPAPNNSGRLRSPRSIGDVFKRLFNGNKRSKQSSSHGGSTSGGSSVGSQPQQSAAREWEQQQQFHQQQQYQQQQQQQQSMATMAASPHAVYAASPFATAPNAAAIYPHYAAPTFSSAGLVAWPTTANFAQALRATPTLIAAQPSSVALTSSGPLFAAGSQSYNSYAPPPVGGQPVASAASQPQAAASHVHPNAVPAPATMGGGGGGGGPSSLDFHQVLDAFVRTSGFAPAGDQEAAAATGYGSKGDGTPVFSFKKLVSLPFYLSTEEKPLEGLANAMGGGPTGSAGYTLHTMPIMRRHVRRMSTPAGQVQQPVAQFSLSQASLPTDAAFQQRSERAQQQHYTNYFNALNNQLASMSTNQQLLQYLADQQQQQQPSTQSQTDAYSAEAALANYQALASLGAQHQMVKSRNSVSQSGGGSSNNNNNIAMAASMITPMAVQAPPQILQQQQQQQQQVSVNNAPLQQQINQRQQYDQQDLQSFLNSIQQLSTAAGEVYSPFTSGAYPGHPTDGHRFGAQQQPLYWSTAASAGQTDGTQQGVAMAPDYGMSQQQLMLQALSQQQVASSPSVGPQQQANNDGANTQQSQLAANANVSQQQSQLQQQHNNIGLASSNGNSHVGQTANTSNNNNNLAHVSQANSSSTLVNGSNNNNSNGSSNNNSNISISNNNVGNNSNGNSNGFNPNGAQIEGQQVKK